MRRLFAGTAGLLTCTVALLAACSSGSHEPLAVTARLGGAGVRGVPAAQLQELRLGSETRAAVCVPPDTTLSLEVEARVSRLLASVGAEKPASAAPSASFSIVEKTSGESRLLLETGLSGDRQGWRDHAIDLAPAAGPRHFELRTRATTEGAGKLCWGAVRFLGTAPAALAAAPNVLLLSLDTLGASYLGGFGHVRGVSPRIDALLDESFSFRRAYTQYPGTLVAHTSLFTGLHPVNHGRYDRSFELRGSFAGELARQGYLSAAFTENANVGSAFGFAAGFDRWDDGEGRGFEAVSGNASTTFANAEAWLAGPARDTRFFLFVHTYEVHSPYAPPAEDVGIADALTPGDARTFPPKDLSVAILRHNQGLAAVPERDAQRFRALYTAEIHHLDRVVGRFLDRLEALGLADDTLLIVTSDHGEQFGEEGKLGHGQTLHNRVLHVPLGFRWPGRVQPGRHDAPVGLVDVVPTLFDLVGFPGPAGRDGRSLAPLLRGEATQLPPRPAFAELQRDRGECQAWPGPGRCWLGRYAVLTDRYKYVSSEFPAWERLYDLEHDPGEAHDVKDERPQELARHRALLEGYRSQASADAPAADDAALDALTRDRLEALGYIE